MRSKTDKAKVESHSANTFTVNQIPTTGQAARKKCKERELLKLAIISINEGIIQVPMNDPLRSGADRRRRTYTALCG
ncbi:hypothetical protein E6C27_scaffold84G00620 [Cucumis melo var. makuwa]|uniref:Uncharacterized protein n=1 Tax=Cucumis melo var. makuwa TaxID=1194695 RepID=A0A5A7TBI4_CUCMM|nr:hypothetical protein E6C27_scaffold84G00620 [Cucumis melo var. makuwa]